MRAVEPVRRSVAVFGAHLCGLDLRQNSAVHEQVIADLFVARLTGQVAADATPVAVQLVVPAEVLLGDDDPQDGVGVDDGRTVGGEQFSDGALAAADAPGQTDAQRRAR